AAREAFKIADIFRARDVPVIMGGVHPTFRTAECLQHADAVCIGEGETIWTDMLQDWEANRLKKIYQAQTPMNPVILPTLNRTLFPKKGYLIHNTVLTSRGCPHYCDFCLVKNLYGPQYRLRKIADVVAEVESLQPGPKPLVFVDDNIVGDPAFAKELFRALIPLKIKWLSQCSITITEDDELLDLAAQSGCRGLFIGFESIHPHNLHAFHKDINRVENFYRAVRKLKAHRIFVHGAFIFGFDGDDDTVFEKTLTFARDLELAVANFGILTPYPGTILFDRLEKEKRIFDYDWSHYDSAHVVFTPQKMDPATLQKGQYYAMKEFYSFSSMFQRLGVAASPFLWILNLAHLNIVKELKKIAQ
ncbi:MAG TPA: radical SAM protein, partial [Candidatus Deferrimicrobium sp.]|nr:radical SAM protein [Candidatus Deferrimicrobium sp.]